jgi:hypothetical protein
MKWTVGRRIGVGFSVILLLLSLLAGVGVLTLFRAASAFGAAIQEQERRLALVRKADGALADATIGFLRFLVAPEEGTLRDWETGVAAARQAMTDLRDASLDAELRDGWTEGLRQLASWEEACRLAAEAQQAGRRDEALRLRAERITPARKQRDALVDRLVESQRARTRDLAQAAYQGAVRAVWTILIVAALTLVVGATIAVVTTRGVAGPLGETIGTLASSCSEILAATTQQAAGTAEEASAVQETSTTVDEVRQTAQLSAQKARAVTDAVQKTAQVSQEGRRAVDETVKGMRDTRSRMEAIAERILALSERGQAIGEIIATVNDLAEQSNLLAVNAAIEAAKAGEAGRGFAVVAAEVKALAERSKQATAQVRGILGEIQRATQAAVMAAEQGVKASEAGVAIASEAGEAIRLLADGLTESAQAAQQILASAQQQSTGTEQIGVAMQNIQQASAQNMASTRQVERAAQDLNELAGRLRDLVAPTGRQGGAARGA